MFFFINRHFDVEVWDYVIPILHSKNMFSCSRMYLGAQKIRL